MQASTAGYDITTSTDIVGYRDGLKSLVAKPSASG
jgi:hypothetical protein